LKEVLKNNKEISVRVHTNYEYEKREEDIINTLDNHEGLLDQALNDHDVNDQEPNITKTQ
jgi:hypothetical protein